MYMRCSCVRLLYRAEREGGFSVSWCEWSYYHTALGLTFGICFDPQQTSRHQLVSQGSIQTAAASV